MNFVGTGSNSQVYYDNLHSRLSADFQHRVLLFMWALPWSLKQCRGLQRNHNCDLILPSKQRCNQLIFSGRGQNNCCLMIHLTTEHVFENFGGGAIVPLSSQLLRDQLARHVSQWRNWQGGNGATRPPGKLNVETGPLQLIFWHLLFFWFSVGCYFFAFFGVFLFF